MKTLLALVFLPLQAFAQYDLSYSGALMIGTQTIGAVTTPMSGSWGGDLILNGPLADNLNNAPITPSSIMFIGVNGESVSELSQLGSDPFRFSTNSQGQITAWSMTLNDGAGGSAAFGSTFTSSNGFDGFQESGNCRVDLGGGNIGNTPCSILMASTKPGAWFSDVPGQGLRQISVAAPEIDHKGRVGGFLLLAGGLAVLRGRRALQ